MTWNVEMFSQAGLEPNKAPADLDAFREYSSKLAVREGSELKRVGYAIRHVGHPHGIVDKWDWLSVSAGVKYVDLTPEKAKKIFTEHVQGGKIVNEYALAAGSERTL